jgi:virulence factor Mce-like protein
MQKRAPTLGNILVIILFVLSCFGLLMFLWESFGGPLPLKPKGYRFSVAFPRALALAEESDVRISGVDVGHVVSVKLGNDGRTHAEIELSGKYAPIRADMHAILRQKTLLGETYVQLLPEANSGPDLKDGAQLPDSQVEPSVTLDDILATFDPKTRKDFQIWQQAAAQAINNRGEQINSDFAELEPFAQSGNKLLAILASQEGALRDVIKNTGVVFNALASREHQLEGLIVNGEHTFHAAAEGSQAFAEAFKALPAFEHNSRVALKELDKFAADATPFLAEFRPAERKLSSLLQAAKPFTPQFDAFLTSIGPLTAAAKTGLPDIKKTLDLTTPVLENTAPVLHNLDPFLQYTGEYIPELQAFFANLTAATSSQETTADTFGKGPKLHKLTTMSVLGPESLALYSSKLGTNRSNPYPHNGSLTKVGNGGLEVFSSSGCAASAPAINKNGPTSEAISKEILELLLASKTPLVNEPEQPNRVAAPACNQQAPQTFDGKTSQFPHVVYSGK